MELIKYKGICYNVISYFIWKWGNCSFSTTAAIAEKDNGELIAFIKNNECGEYSLYTISAYKSDLENVRKGGNLILVQDEINLKEMNDIILI